MRRLGQLDTLLGQSDLHVGLDFLVAMSERSKPAQGEPGSLLVGQAMASKLLVSQGPGSSVDVEVRPPVVDLLGELNEPFHIL